MKIHFNFPYWDKYKIICMRVLKGVFAKNERGYRLLIATDLTFIYKEKIIKKNYTEERSTSMYKFRKLYCKIINLISNKSFRYHNLKSSIIF